MKTVTVFYAWQSDRPNNLNRGFIEKALEDAAKQFNVTSQEIKIEIDQDTQGVSGMPPVSQTILDKIASCDIFLPDLTFVTRFEEGPKKDELAPNANVLIEFGYALSKRGHSFLMPVMNTAFGGPNGLPFDMGHLRNPILYKADAKNTNEQRQQERLRLSRELLTALQITIATMPRVPTPLSKITSEIKAWAAGQHNSRMGAIQQLIPVALVSGPKLLMHIFPASAFDQSKELDFARVREQTQNFVPYDFTASINQPDAHSWMFFDPPASDRRSIFPEPGRFTPLPGQSMWYAEISRYGVVEVFAMIDTIGMLDDQGPVALDGTMLEARIVNTVDKIAAALPMIGIEGPAILHTTLLEVFDVRVLRGVRGATCFSRQPIVLPEVIIPTMAPPLADQLRPLLDAMWRAAGVAQGSPGFNAGTWAGYGR